ncbi:MAG: transcription elongation factor GreA [Lachnospiraceae bacterium]|nr:transcription elongation factor GreA [Lachnospiraceae bacterium]MCR5087173.1 transcription elongation factor GreA [Lachnospiraceae bacterium]
MHDRLTQSDIEKMQAEIDYRKLELAPKILQSLKEARAQGDLSENFEYHAAKRDKAKNESRIRYLERMILTAKVFEDSAADDAVAMNNTVTVFSEKTGREITFRIVTTIRANPIKRLISIESPIGKAIYGRRVGERRLVETETGETYYVEIRSIDKTTDDTEDEISRY